MAKKNRYYDSEMYAGMRQRMMMESEDYGMINEDRSQIANMPQQVVMKAYPKVDYTMRDVLNDTIKGIDVQERDDNKRKKQGPYPEMY